MMYPSIDFPNLFNLKAQIAHLLNSLFIYEIESIGASFVVKHVRKILTEFLLGKASYLHIIAPDIVICIYTVCWKNIRKYISTI